MHDSCLPSINVRPNPASPLHSPHPGVTIATPPPTPPPHPHPFLRETSAVSFYSREQPGVFLDRGPQGLPVPQLLPASVVVMLRKGQANYKALGHTHTYIQYSIQGRA